MQKIDITIIVPAFKPEDYLNRLTERICLLDQEFINKKISAELILIHNGTNHKLIDSVLSTFLNLNAISFNYLQIEKKITPGNARNIGLEVSSGEYIFFHDVDDLMNTDFLENFHNLIRLNKQEKKYDLIIFNYKKIRNGVSELINHGSQISDIRLDKKNLLEYINSYIYEPHIYTLFVHCWSKLYLRSFLIKHKIKFNERFVQLEDVNFNFQMLINKPEIFHSKKIAYDYYVGTDASNLSSKSGINEKKDIVNTLRALGVVKKYLIKSGYDPKEVKTKTRHLYATTYVLWILRVRKRTKSLSKLYRSLDFYISSTIVQSSMRYYKYYPKTSWFLPIFLILRQRLLLTLFLYIKIKG